MILANTSMDEQIATGILGLGNVGAEVAALLNERAGFIAQRVGRPVTLKRVAVRDLHKPRPLELPLDRLTTDYREITRDPEIRVVIELIGGIEPARSAILDALESGKDVITANKALLADHGAEIFEAARRAGRSVSFEGAVAGGIPIVQAIGVALAANRFKSLAAILNGTCNFILSSMSLERLSYERALAHAQTLGYAEADPTLDVDGSDTAHKLAILAQLAFGASVTTDQIPRVGIDQLQEADILFAGELGYTVKLLAIARDHGVAGLELKVGPTLVRQGTPLAEVRGPYNAIRAIGDPLGDALFYGQGAGPKPTASAVLGDLIDVLVGRALATHRSLDLWSNLETPPHLCSFSDVRTRNYLRFTIADRPGVLGSIAKILGDHQVSIASVIQHDPGDDDHPDAPVPLVLMTHQAVESELMAAQTMIDQLDAVVAPTVRMNVHGDF